MKPAVKDSAKPIQATKVKKEELSDKRVKKGSAEEPLEGKAQPSCGRTFSELSGPTCTVAAMKRKARQSREDGESKYLAEGLYQRGTDEDGFCRFLPEDIRQAVNRAAQKTCCVCGKMGATVACQQKRCARKFHFPCGSRQGCVSQFFGEFRSLCWEHRPQQTVETHQDGDTVCIICMEPVEDRTSYSTMVCPFCKHAWFHRGCIQGHALRSALKHFACPLCKDREKFLPEMWRLGIRIPDRRLAWEEEEEQNLEDLYETYSHCDASQCLYRGGREQSEEEGLAEGALGPIIQVINEDIKE
ncbi:PHD finger protein 7-like [Dromaius novaehollandiae]|uniref:PHD finger protein 7-like n=2 Tax=Dromaius novaehollandiae TaxID=8790 RepID=UPI00311E1099